MTTAQKILLFKRIQDSINIMDGDKCIPFGIISYHETDNELMGFSPIFEGQHAPLTCKEYGELLIRIGQNMIISDPVSERIVEINPKTQNLN